LLRDSFVIVYQSVIGLKLINTGWGAVRRGAETVPSGTVRCRYVVPHVEHRTAPHVDTSTLDALLYALHHIAVPCGAAPHGTTLYTATKRTASTVNEP